MDNAKKIGLIACTGIVAGNMMGSGIALLPANLASIGSIAITGWIVALIGALSLAYVFAKLATKDPEEGGPIAYANEVSSALGFQTGALYYSCQLDWESCHYNNGGLLSLCILPYPQ